MKTAVGIPWICSVRAYKYCSNVSNVVQKHISMWLSERRVICDMHCQKWRKGKKKRKTI